MSPPATVSEGGRLDKAAGIVALGLSGIAAYAYLVVAGRALGAAGFAPLGAAWAVVFLVSAALATPLELGLARAVAAARAGGRAVNRLLRAGFVLAGTAAIVALGVALIGGQWFDDAVFGGQAGIALLCAIAFAGLVFGAVAKGACAGASQLAGWGGYLLADGGVRLGIGILAAVLAPSPQAFALALALGPWVALSAPAIPLLRLLGNLGRSASGDGVVGLARSIAPLIVAAFAAAALMYLGAVLLPLQIRGPDAEVGAYIASLALARLPLFVLSPLVAIAIPRIAFALARGDGADARRTAGALVGIAALGGLTVIAVTVIAGGGSLASLFGAGFILPEQSLWAIAIAAACWLFATAATSVAIAAGRGRLSAWAWCAGLAIAGVAAVVASPDAFARTNAAVLFGALAASLTSAVAAVAALRGSTSAGGDATPVLVAGSES